MAALFVRRWQATSIAVFTALAVAASLAATAQTRDSIRVWRIGSPHHGDTPPTAVPLTLAEESARHGVRLTVQSFQADGVAARFREAAARNEAPDVLVFDNMGVMDGITTALGKFEGLREEPAFRDRFIQVTGAFDDLLGPRRGWTYLFRSSPKHKAARTLALRTPACRSRPSARTAAPELGDMVTKVATAYVNGDVGTLLAHSDPDRIPPRASNRKPVTAGEVRVCSAWGNARLQFVSANAAYEGDSVIGHQRVLLVFRKSSGEWQLLTAARDPVSNGRFVQALASMPDLFAPAESSGGIPIPATLLSPDPGEYPLPARRQRFGTFSWESSPSDDVVAEIAEFAYQDDARLILKPRQGRGARSQVSAGELWTTRGEWSWRILSISRAGDVAFSDVRIFTH